MSEVNMKNKDQFKTYGTSTAASPLIISYQ